MTGWASAALGRPECEPAQRDPEIRLNHVDELAAVLPTARRSRIQIGVFLLPGGSMQHTMLNPTEPLTFNVWHAAAPRPAREKFGLLRSPQPA